MRERSRRQDVPEQSAPKGWRGVLVWCPLPCFLTRAICSLMVKEKLNIFPLGLSPNLEAEGKRCGEGWLWGLRFWDAKPRRLCGRRPGLFSLAKDARRGEPMTSAKMQKVSRRGVAAGRAEG